ncbi:MAG: HD domain-containing protein [Rhodothermales bacterium]|nr:HD domain-containing protein [Rhodothermales bacterium]
MQSRIFSDPVHGFISVDGSLLLSLIQQPEVQRLRRIRQLGVGYLVFPGAEHSRFGHALGAMALMDDALQSLRKQGVSITDEEHEAARIAALMHDIGHGPFSHTLENDLISEFQHEDMSRVLLVEINNRFDGALDLAIEIFDGSYPSPVFHQLVSSQLDMDRLDYLRRDSYYTGVMEGVVGVDRIIKMMRLFVNNDGSGTLAFDQKATYTIENFLQARRFMYWQVYLHRGVIAGDHVLKSILRRARFLHANGRLDVPASPALSYFVTNSVDSSTISSDIVWRSYSALDDSDILYSIKQWRSSKDFVLSDLSDRFINRRLFKVRFQSVSSSAERLARAKSRVVRWIQDSRASESDGIEDTLTYYLHSGSVTHTAYKRATGGIQLVAGDRLVELSELDAATAVMALTQNEERHYIAYPPEIEPVE